MNSNQDTYSKYKPHIQTLRAVNHALTQFRPVKHGASAVRGNESIYPLKGTAFIREGYHKYLRQLAGRVGRRLSIDHLPDDTQSVINRLDALNKEYRSLVRPMLDIFEDVHGKGSAKPQKIENIGEKKPPSFNLFKKLCAIIENDYRRYDWRSYEESKENVEQFLSDYKAFIRDEFNPSLKVPETIVLKSKNIKDSIELSNKDDVKIVMNASLSGEHVQNEYYQRNASPLRWFLMLKYSSQKLLDTIFIPEPFSDYIEASVGTQQAIAMNLIDHIEANPKLQNPIVLEPLRRATHDIFHEIKDAMGYEEIMSIFERAPVLINSMDLLGLKNLPEDHKATVSKPSKGDTQKMKDKGLVCPFGHGAS